MLRLFTSTIPVLYTVVLYCFALIVIYFCVNIDKTSLFFGKFCRWNWNRKWKIFVSKMCGQDTYWKSIILLLLFRKGLKIVASLKARLFRIFSWRLRVRSVILLYDIPKKNWKINHNYFSLLLCSYSLEPNWVLIAQLKYNINCCKYTRRVMQSRCCCHSPMVNVSSGEREGVLPYIAYMGCAAQLGMNFQPRFINRVNGFLTRPWVPFSYQPGNIFPSIFCRPGYRPTLHLTKTISLSGIKRSNKHLQFVQF